MVGYGSHNQPEGTWSDDTSMALCIADSLCRRYDPDDIMKKFMEWKRYEKYTATGVRFDIGRQTRRVITRYEKGLEAICCGDASENGNGNGGLMRTLPISLYQLFKQGEDEAAIESVLGGVHDVSSLTHAHEYGLISCGIFTMILREWLFFRRESDNIPDVCERGFKKAEEAYLEMGGRFEAAMKTLGLFIQPHDLMNCPEERIESDGYALNTLHSSLWCLLKTDSYRNAVLMAVNMGGDTDTTAAVTGALAGVIYGRDAIPWDWLDKLKRREFIETICDALNRTIFPDQAKSDEIGSFTGEHQYMTLKAGYPVTVGGIEYSNAYAAWLAQSVAVSERERFVGLTAHQARRLARQLTPDPDWERNKEVILFDVCMAKYTQHDKIARKLLATGERRIVYDTTGAHDNEMGRCSCATCANSEAKNLYGKILMKVRETLRREMA